ncbi:protein kinase [Actinomadura sp. ATCC 31491]|uniref:non-specific serine/threonine protein kinase n=1 Tax=Actinomadura luzonensis TaxID=2805427 RepID=A0ABT0G9V1_9ACTN|nr:serine/threonine-protein kinase [Actinomadura luzonensis]MCK2220861.1 protein kinase [Actinomadura luzonensis]
MSDSAAVTVGGRYRLLKAIGRGGMGKVWQAHDEVLGRDVAVKEVLPPPDLTGPEREVFALRTFREARAAGRVAHPGVATVYDVLEEGGHPWIVMQLVPSRTLGELIRSEGPLSPEETARIGLQLMEALRAAHAAGVLHRDVKPDNVLLAEDGRAVLTDFGIATTEDDTPVTRTGVLIGTPAFIAPERAAGGRASAASDLWSLGVTLYLAVEGHSPFQRDNPLTTLGAVMHADPEPLTRAGALAPVLHGLLRKDPAQRMTLDEAERELSAILLGGAAGGAGTLPPTVVVPGGALAADPAADPAAGLAAGPAAGPGAGTAGGAAAGAAGAWAAQAGAAQAGPSQVGPSQAGPSQVGPSQVGPSQAGAPGPGAAHPGAAGPVTPGPGAAAPGAAGAGAAGAGAAGAGVAGATVPAGGGEAGGPVGPGGTAEPGTVVGGGRRRHGVPWAAIAGGAVLVAAVTGGAAWWSGRADGSLRSPSATQPAVVTGNPSPSQSPSRSREPSSAPPTESVRQGDGAPQPQRTADGTPRGTPSPTGDRPSGGPSQKKTPAKTPAKTPRPDPSGQRESDQKDSGSKDSKPAESPGVVEGSG